MRCVTLRAASPVRSITAREKGRSIADITGKVISGRGRLMFLCFVLVLTWIVLAVFAMAIQKLFMKQPSTVLPINIEILLAIGIGWVIHKKNKAPLVPSLVALGVLGLWWLYRRKRPLPDPSGQRS